MSPERLPGLLLVASLAAALASGLWRARRWRAGRPADVDLMPAGAPARGCMC